MPARVLILVQNEPLPQDRHVWNQCLALTRAGLEVSVICPQGAERHREPFERLHGVDIHRYRARQATGGVAGYAVEYAAALWSMRGLARRLARERPFDLVHACGPPDFLLLSMLSLRRAGARFVFDHHDLTPELFATRFGRAGGLVHRVTLLAEQVAFHPADVVLSVNDSYRDVALVRGRRRPQDVFVVRTGPDLARFVPTPPDPALKRAAVPAQLRRRHGRGLGDAVEFTGWVEHETVSRVLSTSDVCRRRQHPRTSAARARTSRRSRSPRSRRCPSGCCAGSSTTGSSSSS